MKIRIVKTPFDKIFNIGEEPTDHLTVSNFDTKRAISVIRNQNSEAFPENIIAIAVEEVGFSSMIIEDALNTSQVYDAATEKPLEDIRAIFQVADKGHECQFSFVETIRDEEGKILFAPVNLTGSIKVDLPIITEDHSISDDAYSLIVNRLKISYNEINSYSKVLLEDCLQKSLELRSNDVSEDKIEMYVKNYFNEIEKTNILGSLNLSTKILEKIRK